MGFFRKILSSGQPPDHRQARSWDERPGWMRDGLQVYVSNGTAPLDVVGESYRQENLWQLAGGQRSQEERVRVPVLAVLVPEENNPYDPNAVSVWVNGLKVGYLSRDDAQRYRPGLLALQHEHGMPIALHGDIFGGGMREDGPGKLGVFLRHSPADFGLAAPPSATPDGGMRTGLSNVFAAGNDTGMHHLDWTLHLPADSIRAVTAIRQLLARESDPLSRHFMHAQLETLLYKSREVFASALDEYDQACRRHDAEMERIRQAFMAEWGKVPVLEIYRQMAIRQYKAKQFEQALWWAERGMVIYGEDAARPEAVEDLRRRAATYRAKLMPVIQRPGAASSQGNSEVETLVCVACGHEFQRTRVRGRKPMRCPTCVSAHADAAGERQAV